MGRRFGRGGFKCGFKGFLGVRKVKAVVGKSMLSGGSSMCNGFEVGRFYVVGE